jgi:hypothetical protein
MPKRFPSLEDKCDWIHNLPVVGMAILFFGCASLAVAGIYAVVVEFPTSLLTRARAFSPSMLSPLGTLFALFALFTAAQVWNDNDRASAAVAQEASALRNALVFATAFPGEPRSRLETLIHSYIEEAATKEWPMMARSDRDVGDCSKQSDRSFTAYACSDAQQPRQGDRTT